MLLWLRGSVACLTYQSRSPAEGTSLRCPASPTQEGERRIKTPQAHPLVIQGVRRRDLLKAGLAAGVTLSAWPLPRPQVLWAAEAGQPKRGGILRVRGIDPPHFDPHLTLNFKTHTTLSFAYSTLVRYTVGADVRPGTFIVEPHLAERWEQPDDTT